MRKLYVLLFTAFTFIALSSTAQVSVTATAGTLGPTAYTNLSSAFAAINSGTHQGAITVSISASFTEAANAVLNSSGAGSANYTSVLIRPTSDGVNVSFASGSGRGIIELNGADNVTIDGDNPNTGGTNRNLTFTNTSTNTTTFTSVIRLALSTLVTSADNVTIKNCILAGSGTGMNVSTVTSETTSWGIVASGGASTVDPTAAPNALASATTTIVSGQTVTNLTITNNNIVTVSRGVAVNGAATTVASGLLVNNNLIGNPTAGATDQVYVMGITVQGSTNAVISGNTIYYEGYVTSTTANRAIDFGAVSATGSGAIIEKNTIGRAKNNNTGGYPAIGINITGGTNHIIRNNFVTNVINTGTAAFSTTFGAFGIRLAGGTGHQVYHNSVNMFGNNTGTGTNIMACFGITSTTITGVDVRNNIFSNTATQSAVTTGSANVSVYLPSSGTSAMALTWNNNAYFSGTTSGLSGIAQVGTTYTVPPSGPTTYGGLYLASDFNSASTSSTLNLRTYTSTLSVAGTNDNASFASATPAPFTSNTNLHLPAGIVSNLESTGANVGVTTDIDGDVRPGPAGSVNGGATAPDLGADEFDGVNCAAAPALTITTAGSTTLCAGASVALNASGGFSSYTWTPSAGLNATNTQTVVASPTTTTTYSLTASIPNGCSRNASITVTVNPAPTITSITATPATVCLNGSSQLNANVASSSGTYCTPSYTTGTGFGDYITNVTLGSINNTTGASPSPYYTYYNTLNTNLTAGSAYTITGTINNGGTEDVAVWIDYNQNGVFEASEKLGEQQTLSFSIPFTVPLTALNGVTRMRVRNVYFTTNIDPCTSYTYGEVEDYNVTIVGGASAATYSWTPSSNLSSTTVANPNATNLTTSTAYTVKVTGANGCVSSGTVSVLVDQATTPTITPPSATICNGTIQSLTATSNNTAAVGTTSSGAITVNIPDNNAAGTTSAINVSGIPAGAIVTNIAVTYNITHTFDGDLIINLKAPNNNILNLSNRRGGSGDNFQNTVVSSFSGTPNISTGSAPFIGQYGPDGATGVGPTGYTSNVINFAGLFSAANGTWTLAVNDNAGADVGTINSWSVTIYYLTADNITWTPTTELYTNAGATTAYTGTNLATVYAKPTVTRTYTATAKTGGNCTTTASVTITVNQPPTITTQPTNQNVCPGSTAVFSVAATGTALTYQWRKNGVNLTNGGNISGVTTTTLTITNATAADNGNYDVVINGTCSPNTTSVAAVLTVGAPPPITLQPQSQTACATNNVSFTVASSTLGVTYQWRKNGVNLVNDGTHIVGATSNTLTILNITAADAGNYDVIVTNSCGQSTTSAVAVLTLTTTDRWLGTSNSNWNNPANWCGGVPTPTTDVQILAGTPFSPIIAVNADVRNLQVDAGATLTVTAAGWLNIYGTTLTLNGTFNATAGTIGLRNSANLNVPALTVANLVMNGAGGITLTGNMNVTTALTLTNGNITLGSNNLVMTGGTIGSASSHIVTNGTGVLTNNNVGTATVVFPVAPDATSYNPVWIANGQGLNYSVGVATGVPGTLANGARAINRTWNITASGSPANNVSLTFGYADADANASCTPTANMEIGYYNGTTWIITTPAGGVVPVGTTTQRNVSTTSKNFGSMVVSNVGGILTPTATPNLNADIYSVKLVPNIVENQSLLRVMSRRAMNVEWTVTDIQGRVIMRFNHGILAGQNDITLKLGQLANGTYQIVGYTDKGTTNVIKFVRL